MEQVNERDGESKIYVNIDGLNIDIKEDISIMNIDSVMREFDSMQVIKSTVEMLHQEIEFLKDEIREKNLLIKILNFRNANDGDKINVNTIDENNYSLEVETTSTNTTNMSINHNEAINEDNNTNYTIESNNSIRYIHKNLVDYDDSLEGDLNEMGNKKFHEPIELQINNYKIKQKEKYDCFKTIDNPFNCTYNKRWDNYDSNQVFNNGSVMLNSTALNSTPTDINDLNDGFVNTSSTIAVKNHVNYILNNNLSYIDHTPNSSEFNSTVENKSFNDYKKNRIINDNNLWPKDTILITGSSILNGIDENRLNSKFNVKVRAFSGAYVDDMYDYLAPLLKKKPSVIILQIGSNDAT